MTNTKLPIGTKVLITSPNDMFDGDTGIITEYAASWDYMVEFPDGQWGHYNNSDIQPQKVRGFIALPGYTVTMPQRKTQLSAGYDIHVTTDFTLLPGESRVFDTNLSAYMMDDEYLAIHVRSSVGIKGNAVLSNGTSIIDADYIHSDNGGHIKIALRNTGDKVFGNVKGMAVAQGIFMKYLVTDDDCVTTKRIGGIGSTNG